MLPLQVAPKKMGGFQLITDCRHVNASLQVPTFSQQGIKAVVNQIESDDVLLSLDLQDGFFHIGINQAFWKFLGLFWKGKFYVWCVCPFGLSLSPYVFHKCLRQVEIFLSDQGLRLASWVNDFLHMSKPALWLHERDLFLDTLRDLGWKVNYKKSVLKPHTVLDFVGYRVWSNYKGQPWIQAQTNQGSEVACCHQQSVASNAGHASAPCVNMWTVHRNAEGICTRSTVTAQHLQRSLSSRYMGFPTDIVGGCKKGFGMVVSRSDRMKWRTSVSETGRSPGINRRQRIRLGRSDSSGLFRKFQERNIHGQRHVGTFSSLPALKLQRASGGSQGDQVFSPISLGETHPGVDGQCDHLCLPESHGRQRPFQEHSASGPFRDVPGIRYHSDSKVPSGSQQPRSGCSVSPGFDLRLGSSSPHVWSSSTTLGTIHHRSVCVHADSTGQAIQQFFP